MSTEENKAIVRRYLNDFRDDRSTPTLRKYIAEDLLLEHIAFYDAVFPGYWIELQDLVAEGDKVACRGTIHGTHKGELMGLAPTGRTVAFELIIIYQLADGRIVNHWMQTDAVSMLQQLGALPAAA